MQPERGLTGRVFVLLLLRRKIVSLDGWIAISTLGAQPRQCIQGAYAWRAITEGPPHMYALAQQNAL